MMTFLAVSAVAEEAEHAAEKPAEKNESAHGEHGDHAKPPPTPSKGTPVGDVYHLPVVENWRKWMEANDGKIAIWGESLTSINGQMYSRVAVGQNRGGVVLWKHFNVPVAGGDVMVEQARANKTDDTTYLTYDDWVSKCKPTERSEGAC